MGTGVPITRGGELLERTDELARLRRELDVVADSGHGRLVLISGEAGVGKTSLVAAFAATNAAVRTLWGACDSLRTPRPLGPLVDIAEQAGGPLVAAVETEAPPGEVLSALLRELRREPSVVVLEDMHWADQASLDVLRLLGRRMASVPALVLVTHRDDELDRAHPLRIVLGQLASTQPVRLDLAPLSIEAVSDLASPLEIDPQALYARTGGNPFFVTEILAAGGVSLPGSVRDAVLARIPRLGEGARRLLDAVAVMPRRAELWLLEEVSPEDLPELENCLASGMLRAERDGVAFRHEIARVAIEDELPPDRARKLHRAVLSALRAAPHAGRNLARLAHHAEGAGDVEAILEFAPAAAERAATLGAHREAAAQLARALRFSGALPAGRRAELLERRSYECYVTDKLADAVEARRMALDEYQSLGDRLREGDCERWLSRLLWFFGENASALSSGRRAVEVLEALTPGPELAMAYSNLAQLAMLSGELDGLREWGGRALELAQRLGQRDIEVHALNNIGTAELAAGHEEGLQKLERSLALAREEGLEEHIARAYTNLGSAAMSLRRYIAAERYLSTGIDYCRRRDLDSWSLYMTGDLAMVRLGRGDLGGAAECADTVLRRPEVAVPSRITPLCVLGLVRGRRGDPDAWPPLDQAAELARSTGEEQRLTPVAAARAEVHWLEGREDLVAEDTDVALALALERGSPWSIGELSVWRRRAGLEVGEAAAAMPYSLELEGDVAGARAAWSELGCPYEAALVVAWGGDPKAGRQSVLALRRLGADAAAKRLGAMLGLRPRRQSRQNPAGLTRRELEVLELLSEGLRNAEIAERLVVTTKTVDHHVSSILAKLDARTRTEAVAAAARLGLEKDR